MAELPRPLEGITVVDFTIALAGPYATQLLGALGATVIKVENPAGGDPSRNNAPYVGDSGLHLAREGANDMSVSMLERGRNKLSVTLDLKKPGGARRLRRPRPQRRRRGRELQRRDGRPDRRRVRAAAEVNPRIVYLSISGFGAGEPGKGMDTIFQALSGLMTTPGSYGDPPVRNAVPFGDLVGPLFGVIGTLSALLMRERTGQGQHVDVALLGALTSLIATEPWDTMERAGIEMRTGNVVPRLAPFGIFAHDRRPRRPLRADRRVRPGCLRGARQPRARGGRALLEPRPEGGELGRAARADRGLGGRADERRGDRRARRATASPPRSCATPRPRCATRARSAGPRRCRSRIPRLGPVDELYGSGFPVRFSGAQRRLRDARRRGSASTTISSSAALLGYPPERIEALRVRRRYLNRRSRRLNRRPSCEKPGSSGERQEPEESAPTEDSGPSGEYQAT